MKNQWQGIAKNEKRIQDTKNVIINNNLFELITKYGPKRGGAFDYGCGWGEFADLLAQKKFDVTAFDDSDEMINRGKEKFRRPVFLTKAEFYKKLTTLNKKFDLVTSNLVLCILKKVEQKKMLENIKNLAKDDGLIVISLCHPCLDYVTQSVLAKRIRPYGFDLKYDQEFKYRKIIHENRIEFDDYHRPLEYYTNLFSKSGLQIIDIGESDVLKTSYFPDFIIFVLKKATP